MHCRDQYVQLVENPLAGNYKDVFQDIALIVFFLFLMAAIALLHRRCFRKPQNLYSILRDKHLPFYLWLKITSAHSKKKSINPNSAHDCEFTGFQIVSITLKTDEVYSWKEPG